MESITVRCPNCQKKQEEPYPKRCGCGRSLLAVLADLRGTARIVPPASFTPGRRLLDGTHGLAAVSERAGPAGPAPFEHDENEW